MYLVRYRAKNYLDLGTHRLNKRGSRSAAKSPPSAGEKKTLRRHLRRETEKRGETGKNGEKRGKTGENGEKRGKTGKDGGKRCPFPPVFPRFPPFWPFPPFSPVPPVFPYCPRFSEKQGGGGKWVAEGWGKRCHFSPAYPACPVSHFQHFPRPQSHTFRNDHGHPYFSHG